ncbi:hypothetical protein [Amycolatopsis suaedae]|uniref:Uncharacterized protein n=1 Tax=Amycolatopsis suaedae TaxID=2510978 RepID=A0A4Q7JAZ4_9PSEU|nr:hypothetical protein [Amycolatopsis suaedae]RZQ64166.1 hypothetical protein EWH70_09225 [Amycolatopsis suaedae]
MDHQLVGPWLIVGGYAAGLVLLLVGNKLDGRRPSGAAVCYALAGITLSETSLYWLSTGTGSDVPTLIWLAFPLVITAWAAWRGYRQKTWMRRLGGSAEPSFGVVPSNGLAVAHDSGAPDSVTAAIEFDHHGHRLLGLEYTLGPRGEPGFPDVAKVAEMVDGTYSMVQLRTPAVPSLVLTPNVGAFEPERFTPLEDARITRNTFGAPKPDALLRRFETGTGFDRRFTVTTSDPEFAAGVLTEEVRELLRDPWFRVREVVFHGGSLYAVESGSLTEERMFANSLRLVRLAAAVPGELWGETFRPESEAEWLGRGRGAFASIRGPLNRRREAADRQPLTAMSLAFRSLVALALLVPGISVAGNAAAALTGLAPEVRLTVTAASEGTAGSGTCTTCGSSDSVDGFYTHDGVTHEVTQMRWMSWDTLPEKDAVVDVSLGPLWWNPIIERADTAVFLLLIALAPLLAGTLLVRATYFPRPRKPKPAPIT